MVAILIIVVICTAVFLVIANSRSFQGCVTQVSHSNADKEGSTIKQFVEPQFVCSVRLIDAHNGFFAAISSILLVVVTAGLVAIGYLQIKTAHNQLRAQVYIATADMVNVAPLPPAVPGQTFQQTNATRINPSAGPFAVIVIKNFGQMTARDVVHFGAICLKEYPLTTNLPPQSPGGARTRMALPPQAGSQKLIQLPTLTDAEIAGLRDGSKAIYVYGDIAYRDGFGRKRITRFRLFHNELGGRVGISGHLTGMDEGNDTT
jgi:hypothetical protein